MPSLDITIDPAPLLKEARVAEILSTSVRTLQAWRLKGMGPPYVRVGRAVRYGHADLVEWIEANTVAPHIPTSNRS